MNLVLQRLTDSVLFPGHPAQRYLLGQCRVLVSVDEGRFHLSISHPDRYPTHDEISEARERLLPLNLWFVMVFPPPEHYVNVHARCFHLWQSRDAEGHDLWSEGSGHKRTGAGS